MVYISLGSNLGDSHQHILDAITELGNCLKIKLLATSSLYLSKPVDGSKQSDFYNATIQIQTSYSPLELLAKCQAIESLHNRVHLYKWGPRSLDVDILCFDNMIIKTDNLIIPHPEIASRDFVLKPLLEISPDLSLPQLGKLSELTTPPKNVFKIKPL